MKDLYVRGTLSLNKLPWIFWKQERIFLKWELGLERLVQRVWSQEWGVHNLVRFIMFLKWLVKLEEKSGLMEVVVIHAMLFSLLQLELTVPCLEVGLQEPMKAQ